MEEKYYVTINGDAHEIVPSGELMMFSKTGETVSDFKCHKVEFGWHEDLIGYCNDIRNAEMAELRKRLSDKYFQAGVDEKRWSADGEWLTYTFKHCPIVAAYVYDEPRDFVVQEVAVNMHIADSNRIRLKGYEKEEGHTRFEISPLDCFPGQLSYIIDMID